MNGRSKSSSNGNGIRKIMSNIVKVLVCVEVSVDSVSAIQGLEWDDEIPEKAEAEVVSAAKRATIKAIQRLPPESEAPQRVARLSTLTADEPVLSLFVRQLHTFEIIKLELRYSSKVEELKDLIQELEGFAPDVQRLIFLGRQLDDGRTLQHVSMRSKWFQELC